jgi:hypothetical protein
MPRNSPKLIVPLARGEAGAGGWVGRRPPAGAPRIWEKLYTHLPSASMSAIMAATSAFCGSNPSARMATLSSLASIVPAARRRRGEPARGRRAAALQPPPRRATAAGAHPHPSRRCQTSQRPRGSRSYARRSAQTPAPAQTRGRRRRCRWRRRKTTRASPTRRAAAAARRAWHMVRGGRAALGGRPPRREKKNSHTRGDDTEREERSWRVDATRRNTRTI